MSPASAKAYRAGLAKVTSPGVVALVLAGTFPLMLERGWRTGGVDLRETLLQQGKRGVNTSKLGYLYRRVMIRHDTGTGTGARYVGARPGDAEARLGRPNPAETRAAVLRAAKRVRAGGRLPDMTPTVGLLRERHATSIYSGMRRGAARTGLRTWRTISNNPASLRSDIDGTNWHHPGIRPRLLAPKVLAWINSVAPTMIAAIRNRA